MSIPANSSAAQTQILLVPGIGNSGPEHWQTRWEAQFPYCRRIQQHDWDRPVCADWLEPLDEAVREAGPHTVIVAHSLGCLLVAHWAARFSARVKGALLVAAPDPYGTNFPAQARGFTPVPQERLPFSTILVASDNDQYADLEFAQGCAHSWDSQLVTIGAKGHINSESGLGDWGEGQALLWELMR